MILCISQVVQGAEATKVQGSDLKVCRAVSKCAKRLDNGKKCKILPVPTGAIVPVVAPGTFKLSLLRKSVWLYNDGVYLALIIFQKGRLVMVDIPDSAGSNKPDGSLTRLTDAAEQVMSGNTPKKIEIIYSHEHFDHIGGTKKFFTYMKNKFPSAPIGVWGTVAAENLIKNANVDKAVIPNMLIGEDGRKIVLGEGLAIEMNIFGGHAREDLVVYIPSSRGEPGIVMYVDVVFPKWVPPLDLAITVDVGRYISAQRELLEVDFDIFVGGHFRMGDKQDLLNNVKYSEDLIDAARVAFNTVGDEELAKAGIGRFSNPSAREFGNLWYLLFRVTRKAQMDVCYRIMLEKWGCRLAGIDITGRGHCLTAITFLLTDN